jgi:carbon monoxide dehydrogenase subunit G
MNIEHSIIVQNSLNDVFTYLSDLKNRQEFAALAEVASQQDVATKGAKYFEGFKMFGKHQRFRFVVTQFIENHIIKAKNADNDFPIEEIFEVKEDEAGTKISWKVAMQPQGFSKVLKPIIKSNISRQISQQMKTLKATLDLALMKQTTLAFAIENDKHWL